MVQFCTCTSVTPCISDKSYNNECKPPLAMPRGKLQLATR